METNRWIAWTSWASVAVLWGCFPGGLLQRLIRSSIDAELLSQLRPSDAWLMGRWCALHLLATVALSLALAAMVALIGGLLRIWDARRLFVPICPPQSRVAAPYRLSGEDGVPVKALAGPWPFFASACVIATWFGAPSVPTEGLLVSWAQRIVSAIVLRVLGSVLAVIALLLIPMQDGWRSMRSGEACRFFVELFCERPKGCASEDARLGG